MSRNSIGPSRRDSVVSVRRTAWTIRCTGGNGSEGESEQRLYAVVAWRETPFFTERERAALAWAEAVTQVSQEHVPEEVYAGAHQHFTEKELVDLTVAIIAINGWNRLAISFRSVPGTYQPAAHRTAVATASRESGSRQGRDLTGSY